MRESPRRRRDGGGGIPLFPLVLVVILAGLLLGGGLAHFFGTKAPQKPPSDAVAVVTPPAVMESPEAAAPTPLPTLTPVPSPSPLPSLTPIASPTPLNSATPAIRLSATPLAYVTHVPVRAAITPHPVRPPRRTRRPLPAVPSHVATNVTATPTPSNSVPTIGDQASTVVRSYLSAMAQGNKEAASAYLASGEPTESFLNPSTAVESVRSEALGGSRYRVTADMRSSGAEYYETFRVEAGPGGLQITDHYWIKPQ